MIDLEVKDLGALRSTCAAMGLEFREGQKTHRWYGRWMDDYNQAGSAVAQGLDPKTFGECDHAIRVPGAEYDIGVVTAPDGKRRLVYDNWSGGKGIEKVCGPGLSILKQQYGATVGRKWAKKRGYHVREVRTVDGLRLVCTK